MVHHVVKRRVYSVNEFVKCFCTAGADLVVVFLCNVNYFFCVVLNLNMWFQ